MNTSQEFHRLPIEDSTYRLDEHGPLFICGCPRSGTTFLSKSIGRVTQIEEFSGVIAPPRIMHLIGFHSSMGNTHHVNELLHLMRDVFWQSFWRRILSRSERVSQVALRQKPLTWMFGTPSITNQIFCYKEPFAAFAINEMTDYFPQAKVIHIVRDGRDVADSMERSYPDALSNQVLRSEHLAMQKNSEIGVARAVCDSLVPWWVPEHESTSFLKSSKYGRYIWMWREIVKRMKACEKKMDRNRFLELRYESVISDPVGNAEKIYEFIGLGMNRSLKRRLRAGRASSIGIAGRNQSDQRITEASAIAGETLSSFTHQDIKQNPV
ncbi:sulfotransferase family protein [Rosistilla oblonga]|uniref:sulfotransferase family protein n=1 Tax=Rosistilla oblonga TaxID=2527990 RepID=UPI003A981603